MKRPDTPWYNKYTMQLRDDPACRMRDRPRKGHWNLELEVQVEKFYTDVLGLTDEGLLKTLTALTEVRALKRREVLVETGARQQEVVFVLEGVLRGYYLDMNGREITDCFVVQCGTPAMSSFTLDTPSPISIEALTDCRVLCIPIEEAMRLVGQNMEAMSLYNRLLQQSSQVHWEIKNMLCQHNAMERYQWFLRAYPGLIEQISNKYVASFLGITPVTLSRLRRALREGQDGA